MTQITLPTGGQINYAYTVYSDALSNYSHWASQHTSGGGTTTYVLGNVNTANKTQTVTVTKPSGDYKTYSFNLTNGVGSYGAWKNNVAFYSAAGATLETIAETYQNIGNYFTVPISEVTTLSVPGGNIQKQTTFAYSNYYGIFPSTVKEWNYYTGSPGNPDRITNYTYLSDVNSAYLGKNIFTPLAKGKES